MPYQYGMVLTLTLPDLNNAGARHSIEVDTSKIGHVAQTNTGAAVTLLDGQVLVVLENVSDILLQCDTAGEPHPNVI